MSRRNNLITLLILVITLCIAGYALFNARLLLAGPEITIESPQNGSSFTDPFIELHGTAKQTSFITLNGNELYTDEQGSFVVPLVLAPGTSIMKLSASDRFERKKELTLWYTYTGEILKPATHTMPTLLGTSTDALATSTTDVASSTDSSELE
jgi:hypothetical protein